MAGNLISNLDRLARLSEKVRHVPTIVRRAQARAINKVAEKSRTAARRQILGTAGLQGQLVRNNVDIESKATTERLEAVLRGRRVSIGLGRMTPKQLTVPSKRARGDRSRGIRAGRKAAGVSVLVRRAAGRQQLRRAFLVPLRAGNVGGGNGFGVFVRSSRGKVEHLSTLGPGGWFKAVEPVVIDVASAEWLKALNRQLRFELKNA